MTSVWRADGIDDCSFGQDFTEVQADSGSITGALVGDSQGVEEILWKVETGKDRIAGAFSSDSEIDFAGDVAVGGD